MCVLCACVLCTGLCCVLGIATQPQYHTTTYYLAPPHGKARAEKYINIFNQCLSFDVMRCVYVMCRVWVCVCWTWGLLRLFDQTPTTIQTLPPTSPPLQFSLLVHTTHAGRVRWEPPPNIQNFHLIRPAFPAPNFISLVGFHHPSLLLFINSFLK